jgi:hypothetical protein
MSVEQRISRWVLRHRRRTLIVCVHPHLYRRRPPFVNARMRKNMFFHSNFLVLPSWLTEQVSQSGWTKYAFLVWLTYRRRISIIRTVLSLTCLIWQGQYQCRQTNTHMKSRSLLNIAPSASHEVSSLFSKCSVHPDKDVRQLNEILLQSTWNTICHAHVSLMKFDAEDKNDTSAVWSLLTGGVDKTTMTYMHTFDVISMLKMTENIFMHEIDRTIK